MAASPAKIVATNTAKTAPMTFVITFFLPSAHWL
jgi:hypothetical protein